MIRENATSLLNLIRNNDGLDINNLSSNDKDIPKIVDII